jgi:DNA polymerase I-like protein with 3'-5' exonuclease and polymerase domains
MIEFDVETTGLQPWSGKHDAFLWIFSDGENHEAITYWPEWANDGDPAHEGARARIQEWFNRGHAEGIRAWNAKFDRAFADAAGVFDIPGDGCWHDGMVTAHALNERRSVALKAVASELFGEEAADDQKKLKKWLNEENRRRQKEARENGEPEYERANFSHVPMEILEPYGLEDVILQRQVCDTYEPRLNAELTGVVEFERKALDALYAIEKRGLPAHQDEYRKLEQEVVDNLGKLEDRVMALAREGDPVVYAKELAGPKNWGPGKHHVEVNSEGTVISYEGGAASLDEFNPKSTPQILAALKARGADMSYMSEKDGKLSADAENLRAVDDELAAAILDFRSEFKVLSTYVRPMIGRSYVSAMNVYKEPFIAPDERIHANYRQVGARTGRMSCSDPNMQNQPRDDLRLRYNIVADPGYVFVTCDLTNIEMYLFAAYCGEGRLLDAVRKGEDLHVLTAKMLGLRDRKRPGGGIETARQLGKTYNFSRIYGGGLRTIKRSFRCSMDEARLLKRRFDDAYPEVARLQNRIAYRLEDDGYIADKLISGRRFRVDPRDAYKATNYLVQGTAASLLKYATIKLHEDGVPMVALVHDEVVAHVPVADAKEVAALCEQRMTEFEGLKGVIPLKAEAEIVKRWSDAKQLKLDDDTPYLFTPEWAGGEKRPVPSVDEVLAAA